MNSNADAPPDMECAAQEAAVRLEEKCAVIDALEAAWSSPSLSDDTKLRIIVSIRRTLIDVIVGLEQSSPSSR